MPVKYSAADRAWIKERIKYLRAQGLSHPKAFGQAMSQVARERKYNKLDRKYANLGRRLRRVTKKTGKKKINVLMPNPGGRQRVSQITKRQPSARLRKRRAKKRVKGYFPNPLKGYFVVGMTPLGRLYYYTGSLGAHAMTSDRRRAIVYLSQAEAHGQAQAVKRAIASKRGGPSLAVAVSDYRPHASIEASMRAALNRSRGLRTPKRAGGR